MVIIVTGTPGTGKTFYAKKLATQLGYDYLDLTQFIKDKGLAGSYDEKRDSLIVDEDMLLAKLMPYAAAHPESVIDGHLSQELPREMVERCIVTKCELKELKRRLEARSYSEEKVRENLDSEIFDVCLREAREHGHEVEVVWTSEELKQ